MLSKRVGSDLEGEAPEYVDEGWWSAVLADEDAYQSSKKETAPKPTATASNLATVNWDRVQELYDQDEIIQLSVQGYNRGGLLVQGEGIQGFVPVSHLLDMPNGIDEEERRRRLAAYVGQTLCLKVIECESALERIVLSERAAQAGEGRRKELFQSLKIGENVHGIVTNVTEFGVFVDLGGVEGLIHVSELSWGRVQHPQEILKVGQDVQALVLQISEENSRVALSVKRLHNNPWETLVARYNPGDIVPATITAIMRFGAFARLEEGVEGLIHISTINLPTDQKDLDVVLHPGQEVQVKILHIEAERRRLGLGLVTLE
jgi:small subunit ribosomal protein S1